MKKDQKYNKRKNSMEAYIDALIENNSKICTIRIDLGYGTPYVNKVTLDDMNKDINNLLNNRRSKKTLFEHNIGYIIKKEHGENGKGVHGHAYLFYDGNKVQKEVYIAKQIYQKFLHTLLHHLKKFLYLQVMSKVLLSR